jgi:hypothetical protein
VSFSSVHVYGLLSFKNFREKKKHLALGILKMGFDYTVQCDAFTCFDQLVTIIRRKTTTRLGNYCYINNNTSGSKLSEVLYINSLN